MTTPRSLASSTSAEAVNAPSASLPLAGGDPSPSATPNEKLRDCGVEQVETVEIWEKVDDRNIVAHVWVYDPPALEEPWYAKQTYTKLTDPEHRLRIRYWHCGENPNNVVEQTDTGTSDFSNFTFTERDDQ